jgi:hypothetical protein
LESREGVLKKYKRDRFIEREGKYKKEISTSPLPNPPFYYNPPPLPI